jgi:ABC-type molybdate transport system substrate-binding protein
MSACPPVAAQKQTSREVREGPQNCPVVQHMMLKYFRPAVAEAAEVKLLCAVAMKSVLDELAPAFERSTGHRAIITYGTAGTLRDKIRNGEAFDAALLPTPFMDPLTAQGMIDSGSVTVVARSLVSVGVRAGSAKPDISTVPAFKRAMLEAKSISYADPAQGGGSGIQVARVLETLGIADVMKPKTKLVPGPESVDLVANGEAECRVNSIRALRHQGFCVQNRDCSEGAATRGGESADPITQDAATRLIAASPIPVFMGLSHGG